MQLSPHVEALLADVADIAAVGDEATAEAARRLSVALRSAAGLRFLDALTEATLELSAQLSSGHIEVRLAGQDPSLVYVEESTDVESAPEHIEYLTDKRPVRRVRRRPIRR